MMNRARRAALPALLLATMLACATTPEGRSQLNPGPLNLSDADFWSDPRRTRGDLEGPLMDAGRDVLLFDAPAVVPIDVRDTAPTQALRVARLSTLRERPFREHAVIVAVDLDNNIVQAAQALEPPTRQVPPAMPASDRPAQEGMGGETYAIDLRQRLELPWEPGRWQARLIVGDTVTPPRTLELHTTSSPVDPEVQRFQTAERHKTRVPALVPSPAVSGTDYARDQNTPPLPTGTGLVLSAPRVCEQGVPCLLRGSFRLPVLKRHIVPAGAAFAGTEALRTQWATEMPTGTRLPSAVVPVTLIGVASPGGTPSVWRLVLPVFEALDFSTPQPTGIGAFTLDLRGLAGFADQEQTWFLYGLSDEAFIGPLPVGLTRRPRTP